MKKLKKIFNIAFVIFVSNVIGIFTKVKNNRVLFLSDVRKELGGNLKSMDDIISSKEYDKKYCLKEDRGIKRSITSKLNMMILITTSKYILLDDFVSTISLIRRKKGQEIIQLWHGPGAYKTFGLSRGDKEIKGVKKYLTHRNYTKSIVTSEEIKWCFAEGFGMPIENVKATGFPRTDIFFDKKYIERVQKDLYDKYPFAKNKKVILFAPTYRGNNTKIASYDYSKLDLDKIYKELNKEYIFIFKWHPALFYNDETTNFSKKLENYKNFYYEFSSYRDINDLLLITSILITDYSSVIFDYLLVNKPIVYFAYDLEEYEKGRGLYYPFKDYVYGNVATTSEELIDNIKKEDLLLKERKAFNKKFMNKCDGKSTKKTYDMIFKDK